MKFRSKRNITGRSDILKDARRQKKKKFTGGEGRAKPSSDVYYTLVALRASERFESWIIAGDSSARRCQGIFILVSREINEPRPRFSLFSVRFWMHDLFRRPRKHCNKRGYWYEFYWLLRDIRIQWVRKNVWVGFILKWNNFRKPSEETGNRNHNLLRHPIRQKFSQQS